MKEEYLHQDLTRKVIGAAMKVLNELGPSLDEKVYEHALILELLAGGHRVDQQRRYPIHYRNHLVGTLIPDLLVDDAVIVDPKVATAFTEDHFAQMIGYLAITNLEVALLLNFKFAKLQWKRIVRTNRHGDPDLHGSDDQS